MPIKKSSDQRKITLEEFYIELSETSTNQSVDVGKKMHEFVKMINETFKETKLWGLTSHERLVIQSKDSSKSKWYVIISNIGTDDYYFEYLMPENKQPWLNAMIRGQARSLKEAKKYLLIAMKESEGWKGNLELERLINEIK